MLLAANAQPSTLFWIFLARLSCAATLEACIGGRRVCVHVCASARLRVCVCARARYYCQSTIPGPRSVGRSRHRLPWGGRPCQPCTVGTSLSLPAVRPGGRRGSAVRIVPDSTQNLSSRRRYSAYRGSCKEIYRKRLHTRRPADLARVPRPGECLEIASVGNLAIYPGGRLLRLLVGRVLDAFLLDRLASLQPHARAASVYASVRTSNILGGQILSGASRRCAQAGWAGDRLTRPRSTSPHQNLHGASRGSTRPQPLEPEHATRLRAVVKSACQRVRPACRWSSWPRGQPC